ncbi:unnamed protein product [Peniophora sp. CBMAI 1063]|nr:unnamed protein product [Peniophora sp. CBMAI 1063]
MDPSASTAELKQVWTQRLSELNDATAIERSFREAQEIFRLHALRMNDFNRVASLPVEILEEVFLAARDDCTNPHGPNLTWLSGSNWIVVSQVCHRWRQAALASTRLWTIIDAEMYSPNLRKGLLQRLGPQPFGLFASAKRHQEFLSCHELRQRACTQMQDLTLFFEDSVVFPGSILDIIFSHDRCCEDPVLQRLTLTCRDPNNIYWASLRRLSSNLKTLYLTYLYPVGPAPAVLPRLTTLTFAMVILTPSEGVPGILELLRVMPVLESLTLVSCTFAESQEDLAVVLPESFAIMEIRVFSQLYLHQGLSLSRLLEQSAGDRKFNAQNLPIEDGRALFAEVKKVVDKGHTVREIVVDFRGFGLIDVNVEFRTTPNEGSYRIHFPHVSPPHWTAFCSSIAGIDLRDATLRVVSDDSVPSMYSPNINALAELKRSTVSIVHVSGGLACSAIVDLFIAMHLDEEGFAVLGTPSLPYPELRDIIVDNFTHRSPPSANSNLHSYSVPQCLRTLDESALHLLWYARARRNRAMKPLRTIVLPGELLQKSWVEELKELVEDGVVSCDAHSHSSEEVETASCRAVVLYRPVFRAMTSFEARYLAVGAPVIGMLGLLWSASRHK